VDAGQRPARIRGVPPRPGRRSEPRRRAGHVHPRRRPRLRYHQIRYVGPPPFRFAPHPALMSSPQHHRNQGRQDMTNHTTGTREEWLAARRELLAAEKELTRRGDELARQRQALPWVPIDKDYDFDTDDGSASLTDLFRGNSQLLIYHLMYGPDYTGACPVCT